MMEYKNRRRGIPGFTEVEIQILCDNTARHPKGRRERVRTFRQHKMGGWEVWLSPRQTLERAEYGLVGDKRYHPSSLGPTLGRGEEIRVNHRITCRHCDSPDLTLREPTLFQILDKLAQNSVSQITIANFAAIVSSRKNES